MYHVLIHYIMIGNFKNSLTEDVFNGVFRKGFPADLVKIARRKLRLLHNAHLLADLRTPPGNRLEAGRAGQYSIRVNDQFRICFIWTSDGPKDVELTDYH
jgi:proteic killer suppression protein